MPVRKETIVEALKEMEKLEKFALVNLIVVSRDRFSPFPPSLRKKIFSLLAQLKDDTGEHQKVISKIIERLKHEPPKKRI